MIHIIVIGTNFLWRVRMPADIMKHPPQMPIPIQSTHSYSVNNVTTCLTEILYSIIITQQTILDISGCKVV
jgi:hypothetical protein